MSAAEIVFTRMADELPLMAQRIEMKFAILTRDRSRTIIRKW